MMTVVRKPSCHVCNTGELLLTHIKYPHARKEIRLSPALRSMIEGLPLGPSTSLISLLALSPKFPVFFPPTVAAAAAGGGLRMDCVNNRGRRRCDATNQLMPCMQYDCVATRMRQRQAFSC